MINIRLALLIMLPYFMGMLIGIVCDKDLLSIWLISPIGGAFVGILYYIYATYFLK